MHDLVVGTDGGFQPFRGTSNGTVVDVFRTQARHFLRERVQSFQVLGVIKNPPELDQIGEEQGFELVPLEIRTKARISEFLSEHLRGVVRALACVCYAKKLPKLREIIREAIEIK
jgi:hypothetical protein